MTLTEQQKLLVYQGALIGGLTAVLKNCEAGIISKDQAIQYLCNMVGEFEDRIAEEFVEKDSSSADCAPDKFEIVEPSQGEAS